MSDSRKEAPSSKWLQLSYGHYVKVTRHQAPGNSSSLGTEEVSPTGSSLCSTLSDDVPDDGLSLAVDK